MKSNRIQFNYPNFGFGGSFGRLIQGAFEGLEDLGGLLDPSAGLAQAPRIDLYEDGEHYFVVSELPGLKKSDIQVELADGAVTISAILSQQTTDGRKNIPLQRAVPLPDHVGEGEVRAKFEDGILTVTLPKAAPARALSIEIE